MNEFTARIAIIFLGLIALATVIGGIVLAAGDNTLPEAVIAIGSGAAGALGGVLVVGRASR